MNEIRELTFEEIESVNGAVDWTSGGMMVLGVSGYSPVTAAFGVPIGLSMLAIGYF